MESKEQPCRKGSEEHSRAGEPGQPRSCYSRGQEPDKRTAPGCSPGTKGLSVAQASKHVFCFPPCAHAGLPETQLLLDFAVKPSLGLPLPAGSAET